jgi:acyl-CoA thioesterase-2
MTTTPAPGGSILDALDLEPVDDRLFVAPPLPGPARRTFGGTVAGQAVLAACLTAPVDRPIHSAHTYFVLPGDSAVPTEFEVEAVRDGGSFSTRRVDARQHGRTIFTMVASFQRDEPGLAHQVPTLTVPLPEDTPSIEETFAEGPETLAWARFLTATHGVDALFPVPPARAFAAAGETSDPHQAVWLRSTRPVPGGRTEQAACLACFSDMLLLSAALGPHSRTLQDTSLQFATINHTIWFHAPLRVDEWFLYDQRSRWAGGARALCHGEILDRTGRLCATTMQEGLLRIRRG